jgi:predicted transcriptional regulator YdeE
LEKGKYAKFVVNGNMEDIKKFWVEVWNDRSLPRTYKFDFEEYQNDDMENMEVYVYLSIE